ncbi:MAG: VOC family protein [Clostridiales bacterium]|nr:VOC family protein [Clostridiales bacterium]
MKFLWCTILINDLNKSLDFYQDIVGLPISDRFKTDKGYEIIFLGDGETKIELIYDEKNKVSEKKGITIAFEVDSLEVMIERVNKKGFEVHSGPFETPDIRYFFVRDPNGVNVQFVEWK